MNIIKAHAEIEDELDAGVIMRKLEKCGRTCYKSEGKSDGTYEGACKFVAGILKRGHESVIEHVNVTVRFFCDRGVSHEIVRHRIASYSQESTRYCNYGNADDGVTFIEPLFWPVGTAHGYEWIDSMKHAEEHYLRMIEHGAAPQQARSVLPNSTKTEVVMTTNLREWRHFFKLRTAKAAHPQMREVAIPLLREFQRKIPLIFDDILVDETP